MANHSTRTSAQNTTQAITEIARILDDDAVLPLRLAADKFDELAGLLSGIVALASDRANPTASLTAIERIAKCGRYVAADFSELVGRTGEKLEDQQIPAILAAVQGGGRG